MSNSIDFSKTLFISDLHLSEQHPELTALFVKFIQKIIDDVEKKLYKLDNLYILGDFFNYWIGNDSIEPWHQPIINILGKLSQHTKIYFMLGNRDFLISPATCKMFHVELVSDDFKVIEVYNSKIAILHGDTLCSNDKNYQRFRKFVRAKIIKNLYLAFPLSLRKKLAVGIKKQSSLNNQHYNNNPCIFDVSELAVNNLLNKTNSDIIVHGHTHKPKLHRYYSNKKYRYVLGDWHKDGAYYLEASSDAKIELKYFK